MLVVGVRQVRLVHLHEVDAHEERLARAGRPVEIIERRLLDVAIEERDPDHALRGRVDVLTVDLEVLVRRFAGLARQRALGHAREHGAELRVHVGEPGRVGVGVGVEVIEAGILHLVVALRGGQSVVGLAEVPFAGEEGAVAGRLQHRGEGPLRRGQPAALALEGHGRHAAAVRRAAGLHGGSAGRAARLGVEGVELHALGRQAVDVRRRHAAPLPAAIGAEIAVTGIVGHQQDDVGLLLRRRGRHPCEPCNNHERYRGTEQSFRYGFHFRFLSLVGTPAAVRSGSGFGDAMPPRSPQRRPHGSRLPRCL